MARKSAANTGPQVTHGTKDKPWTPRLWTGISFTGLISLLARNRCAVTPRRWGMAFLLLVFSLVNAKWWFIQWLIYGRKIRRTELVDAPVFIIGHWRSGTTLLHELFVLDGRHTYPDTFMTFAPNHFLVSAWWAKRLVGLLVPASRPMDNMPVGWDSPQEDEFALCNMGVRSPYLTITFPNRPPQDQEYLDLEHLPPAAVARWKRSLHWLLRCITLHKAKRIVLKSPAHTCRIRVLLEMFPKARFVHIVRDPYVIFPSTVNLWKRLYRDQGLQKPRYTGLEEHVFRTFERMYEVFERDRHLIPEGQFCEVHYEDLVTDPIEQMRAAYEQLGLDGFDEVLPALRQYFVEQADYKTNRYQISPEIRDEIARRWQPYIEKYGYAAEAGAAVDRPAVTI